MTFLFAFFINNYNSLFVSLSDNGNPVTPNNSINQIQSQFFGVNMEGKMIWYF